jgi:hypothetical protein
MAVPKTKMYIHIVSHFSIQFYNLVTHMTDMYMTIQIEHNIFVIYTVIYFYLNFHPKEESTALSCSFGILVYLSQVGSM